MSFYQWLVKQSKRQDPVGDLSRDAKGDTDRPRSSDPRIWRIHLEYRNASEGALKALDQAFEEYNQQSKEV